MATDISEKESESIIASYLCDKQGGKTVKT